ncbi:unnamed protein product [Prunus armeniaca]
MGKKTKKLGKGKEKAAEAEEKRARRETRSSHLRMTSMPFCKGCQGGRVVDKGYRVLGIDFLRVIDGSTFYQTPGANPQATVMMLGRQLWPYSFVCEDVLAMCLYFGLGYITPGQPQRAIVSSNSSFTISITRLTPRSPFAARP